MKCLIFSDSHGFSAPMARVIAMHPDADVIFFCGDGVSDADLLAYGDTRHTWVVVKGNNDLGATFRGESPEKVETINVEGHRIAVTHGHLYGARGGEDRLLYLAEEKKAEIVLFGHTHHAYEHRVTDLPGGAVTLFNPGAVLPEEDGESSFGILTLVGNNVLFSHGKINGWNA